MHIQESILTELIKRLTIEYSGTHNSDPKSPLWGRRAYWRVYVQGHGFACKITTPVKSIKPSQKTLDKLFRAELRKRIEAITETCTTNHYGEVIVYNIDPYSVRSLLKVVEGKYMHLMQSGKE